MRLTTPRLLMTEGAVLVTTLCLAFPAIGAPSGAVEATVGVEGIYYARVTGSELVAKPVDDKAPIVLRIADVTKENGTSIYELRFIGAVPGEYDLRDYLLRIDGEAVADLAPVPVHVGELLPADHDGSLVELVRPTMRGSGGYVFLLSAVGVLWLAPLVWSATTRLRRRRVVSEGVPAAEPTLADQLRPLVESAVEGCLSAEGQARLELLLMGHWRDRLGLGALAPTDALAHMREHPEAGDLLRKLEQWLHWPPGRSEIDLKKVLRPYASARVETEASGHEEGVRP